MFFFKSLPLLKAETLSRDFLAPNFVSSIPPAEVHNYRPLEAVSAVFRGQASLRPFETVG